MADEQEYQEYLEYIGAKPKAPSALESLLGARSNAISSVNEAANAQQAKMLGQLRDLGAPDSAVELVKKASPSADQLASGLAASTPTEGLSQAVKWVGNKTGLSKIPDYIMQKAVGINKYKPGIGTNLIEQGVRGTKSGMKAQVGKKISEQGKVLAEAVDQIPGTIDSAPIVNKVASMGDEFSTSSGIIPEMAKPSMKAVQTTASEIAERGTLSPKEALELKQIAGGLGYSLKSGEPLSKLQSRIAQAESAGYGDQLAKAYGERVAQGGPNIVQSANKNLSSLFKAKRGLEKSAPGMLSLEGLIRNTVASPLAGSYGAAVMSKTPPAIGELGGRLATELSADAPAPSIDEQEYKEYLEYLRSQGSIK